MEPTYRRPISMTNSEKRELFMKLYDPVHEPFQRFCRARCKNTDDAKDLISEVITRAYERFDSLRDRDAFLGFLFGIASNILRKQYRREKFWGWFDVGRAETIHDSNPDGSHSTDVRHLYEAIHKLTPAYQEALVLHYISGFTLEEVASIQHSSLSAVKVRVMRGKQKLANLLGVRNVQQSDESKVRSALTL